MSFLVSNYCASVIVHNKKTSGEKQTALLKRNTRTLLSHDLEDYQSYIELVIEVLQSQNQSSLKSLKNFLTCLASPTAIEAVLAAAIYQLAEVDCDSCRWILRHPDYLMPELDLFELARSCLAQKLEAQGLILGQDFDFSKQGKLQLLTTTLTNQFWEIVSTGEKLIINEMLMINKQNFPRFSKDN